MTTKFFIQDIREPSLRTAALNILKKIEAKKDLAINAGSSEIPFIQADIDIYQSQFEILARAQRVLNSTKE